MSYPTAKNFLFRRVEFCLFALECDWLCPRESNSVWPYAKQVPYLLYYLSGPRSVINLSGN